VLWQQVIPVEAPLLVRLTRDRLGVQIFPFLHPEQTEREVNHHVFLLPTMRRRPGSARTLTVFGPHRRAGAQGQLDRRIDELRPLDQSPLGARTRVRNARGGAPVQYDRYARRNAKMKTRPAALSDEIPDLPVPPPTRFWWANQALRWYFAPEYLHLDRVDAKRPTLFVGNHSVFNVFDVMLFTDALYRERGVSLRSLADRAHFKVPLWRDLVVQQGGVLGTRENCAALMRRGENILVFPGGAREVFKRKGEAYHLVWKERFGFVRLAIDHGYTITPYATIGAEESLDILLDASDYLRSPIGRYLKTTGLADRYLRGGEELPPLVRGLGLTPWPRPEKMYFLVGKPIDMANYQGRSDGRTLRRARDRVCRSLKQLIAAAHKHRARDTTVGTVRRLLNRL